MTWANVIMAMCFRLWDQVSFGKPRFPETVLSVLKEITVSGKTALGFNLVQGSGSTGVNLHLRFVGHERWVLAGSKSPWPIRSDRINGFALRCLLAKMERKRRLESSLVGSALCRTNRL